MLLTLFFLSLMQNYLGALKSKINLMHDIHQGFGMKIFLCMLFTLLPSSPWPSFELRLPKQLLNNCSVLRMMHSQVISGLALGNLLHLCVWGGGVIKVGECE